MWYRRLKVWLMNYWVRLVIIAAVILLLVFTVIGLASLESFYLNLTLATLPLQLLMAALNAVIFVYLYMTVFRGGFSQMKKQKVKSAYVNIKFSDIIGLEQAKREAWEVVQLISDRARLKAIGGKILRGVIMIGPPGCGKTMLAKAIATEAKVPFLSVAGSEFTEVFVGVGASRVRKLFKQARQLAYAEGTCIVFIDEIEVIGRGRTFTSFGGGEETNSTQNQLLVEMDGLGSRRENVIVIGATNAGEQVLDQALMRPGRFDRKLYIDKPNLSEREDLFKYYMAKIQHDPELDVGRLARKSVGKSPAEIENITKEAALIAMRRGGEQVEYPDLTKAIERIELGIEHKKNMTPHEKEAVAYHESGHLVITYLLHPTNDVFKASIIARGGALGVVYHAPREEYHLQDRDTYIAQIKVSLAGYVAEKLRFGVTANGVTSDFRHAMQIAHGMVWAIGMGGNGYLGDYSAIPEQHLSESLKERLNAETEKIIKECYEDTVRVLKKNWHIVDHFVKELLEKEELDYDEIDAVFDQYGLKHSVKEALETTAVTVPEKSDVKGRKPAVKGKPAQANKPRKTNS